MTAGEEAQVEAAAAAAAPAAPGRRLQRTTTMLAYRKVRVQASQLLSFDGWHAWHGVGSGDVRQRTTAMLAYRKVCLFRFGVLEEADVTICCIDESGCEAAVAGT